MASVFELQGNFCQAVLDDSEDVSGNLQYEALSCNQKAQVVCSFRQQQTDPAYTFEMKSKKQRKGNADKAESQLFCLVKAFNTCWIMTAILFLCVKGIGLVTSVFSKPVPFLMAVVADNEKTAETQTAKHSKTMSEPKSEHRDDTYDIVKVRGQNLSVPTGELDESHNSVVQQNKTFNEKHATDMKFSQRGLSEIPLKSGYKLLVFLLTIIVLQYVRHSKVRLLNLLFYFWKKGQSLDIFKNVDLAHKQCVTQKPSVTHGIILSDVKDRKGLSSLIKDLFQFRNLPVTCCFVYPTSLEQYFNNPDIEMHEIMKYEWQRLMSFKPDYTGQSWPLFLARNGFYSDRLEGPNKVRCFFCGMVYLDGERIGEEQLANIHRTVSPTCAHVTGNDALSGNKPIQSATYSDQTSSDLTSSGVLVTTTDVVRSPGPQISTQSQYITTTETGGVSSSSWQQSQISSVPSLPLAAPPTHFIQQTMPDSNNENQESVIAEAEQVIDPMTDPRTRGHAEVMIHSGFKPESVRRAICQLWNETGMLEVDRGKLSNLLLDMQEAENSRESRQMTKHGTSTGRRTSSEGSLSIRGGPSNYRTEEAETSVKTTVQGRHQPEQTLPGSSYTSSNEVFNSVTEESLYPEGAYGPPVLQDPRRTFSTPSTPATGSQQRYSVGSTPHRGSHGRRTSSEGSLSMKRGPSNYRTEEAETSVKTTVQGRNQQEQTLPRSSFTASNEVFNSVTEESLYPEGAYGPPVLQDPRRTFSTPSTLSPTLGSQQKNSVGSTPHRGSHDGSPRHPDYADISARMASFSGWSVATTVQNPIQLAEAGFFYTGTGDCVRCFYCDGGLRNWEKDDEPWIEHAKCSQSCLFLVMTKGEHFIQSVCKPQATAKRIGEGLESQNGDVQQAESAQNAAAAHAVLEMGYDASIVQQAIQLLQQKTGNSYLSAEEILEKVFEMEEAGEDDIGVTEAAGDGVNGATSSYLMPNVPKVKTKEARNGAANVTGFTVASHNTGKPNEGKEDKSEEEISRLSEEPGAVGSAECGVIDASEGGVTEGAGGGVIDASEGGVIDGSEGGVPEGTGGEAAAVLYVETEGAEKEPIQENRTETSQHSTTEKRSKKRNRRKKRNAASSTMPEGRQLLPGSENSPVDAQALSDTVLQVMQLSKKVDDLKTMKESSIQAENEQLKEKIKCKICMDNDIKILFLPCGHQVACKECASQLTECPMCRKKIKKCQRTFLP